MMKLITHLEAIAADEESYFRAYLAREDIERLQKLRSLVSTMPDRDAFIEAGMKVGWTQADARTHQIKDALKAFLSVFHGCETGPEAPGDDDRLLAAWHTFDAERMEKLIRCL